MPDIYFDSMEKVPEELREFAKTEGGKISVNLVPKVTLDGFRNNNITYLQERDAAKAIASKYAGIGSDPDALAAEVIKLRGLEQKVADGTLTAKDDIDRVVEARTKAQREAAEAALREKDAVLARERAEKGTLKADLDRTRIRQAITEAVVDPKIGANPTALEDIFERATRAFKVNENGTVVRMDGEQVVYGADGVKPMSAREWLAKLLVDAPHFAKASAGGGAGGGGNERYGGLSREDFNKLPPEVRMTKAREAAAKGSR